MTQICGDSWTTVMREEGILFTCEFSIKKSVAPVADGTYAFSKSFPGTYYFRTAYSSASPYASSFSRVVKVSVSSDCKDKMDSHISGAKHV